MDGKRLLALTLLFALLIAKAPTLARAALVTVTATAKVLQTLVLNKTADLDFGDGVQGDAAKVLAPGSAGAAAFSVQGEPSHTYLIVLPGSPVNLTRAGGAETIAISAFAHNGGATPTLGAAGTASFSVGATRAALPAAQVAGTYSGSFPVIVTY